MNRKQTDKKNIKVLVIGIIIVIFLIIFVFYSSQNKNPNNNKDTYETHTITTPVNTIQPTKTSINFMDEKVFELTPTIMPSTKNGWKTLIFPKENKNLHSIIRSLGKFH